VGSVERRRRREVFLSLCASEIEKGEGKKMKTGVKEQDEKERVKKGLQG
jgi:hypothetical protein